MALFTEPFSDPLFGVAELIDYVDKKKFVARFLSQLIPRDERGVMSDEVLIEERQRTLNLLPFVPRGGEPTRRLADKRTMRGFKIPAIKVERRILADELLKVRAPGELRRWAYREIVNDALGDMLDEYQSTKEVHLSNMLQGTFKDAVTGAVHYNYFSDLSLTQETEIDFDLDNASPANGAVTTKVMDMQLAMMNNAEDLDVSNIVGLCSAGFWKLLIILPELVNSYRFDASGTASDLLSRDASSGVIRWRGVTWIHYPRTAAGTALVPADKVLLVPISSGEQLYKVRYAPPDFFSEDLSNEVMGRELYIPPITIDPMHPNSPEWVSVELRSFPIYYPIRPMVLMIGRKT